MKKRILAGMLAILLVSILAGCGSTDAEDDASAGSSAEETGGDTLAGGWEADSIYPGIMLPLNIDDSVLADYEGMELEPLAIMGSQIVSGTNYMLLCRGTSAEDGSNAGLYVVVEYVDIEHVQANSAYGNGEIISVTKFNIADYTQTEGAGEDGLDGGWTVDETEVSGSLPDGIQETYDDAMEGLTGADYVPLVYLGSQVVAGSNYAILCRQTLVTAEPVTHLAVVSVFDGLDGTHSLNNICVLDLADFNQ